MDGDEGGIVWMVDGHEVPFEAVGESRRPWLEESASWGDGEQRPPKKDDGSEPSAPSELIWV